MAIHPSPAREFGPARRDPADWGPGGHQCRIRCGGRRIRHFGSRTTAYAETGKRMARSPFTTPKTLGLRGSAALRSDRRSGLLVSVAIPRIAETRTNRGNFMAGPRLGGRSARKIFSNSAGLPHHSVLLVH